MTNMIMMKCLRKEKIVILMILGRSMIDKNNTNVICVRLLVLVFFLLFSILLS